MSYSSNIYTVMYLLTLTNDYRSNQWQKSSSCINIDQYYYLWYPRQVLTTVFVIACNLLILVIRIRVVQNQTVNSMVVGSILAQEIELFLVLCFGNKAKRGFMLCHLTRNVSKWRTEWLNTRFQFLTTYPAMWNTAYCWTLHKIEKLSIFE